VLMFAILHSCRCSKVKYPSPYRRKRVPEVS
jgi:hypothetical protein